MYNANLFLFFCGCLVSLLSMKQLLSSLLFILKFLNFWILFGFVYLNHPAQWDGSVISDRCHQVWKIYVNARWWKKRPYMANHPLRPIHVLCTWSPGPKKKHFNNSVPCLKYTYTYINTCCHWDSIINKYTKWGIINELLLIKAK